MQMQSTTTRSLSALPIALLVVAILWGVAAVFAGDLTMGRVGPSDAFDDKRTAALVNAIGREDLAAIDASLAEGADINAYDRYQNTPLHWALTKQGIQAATIEHLLKKGANPALPDKDRDAPLWLLANSNRPDLLETMLRNGGDPSMRNWDSADSLLGLATLAQWEDNINVLLKYGANINAVDPFGNGFICRKATAVGRFDLVVRYLELGLNVDLEGCAFHLEHRIIPDDSPQHQWRQKAFDLMQKKGLKLPLPPPPPKEKAAPPK